MELATLDHIVIRHGSIKGRELGDPKRLERDSTNFSQSGIIVQTGPNLADHVVSVLTPNYKSGTPLGKIHYLENRIVYTPFHPEIGNLLHRKQYDVDIVPDIADDEHAPHLENPQEHILSCNHPFPLRRGDLVIARFYHEGIKNIAGTYVELYNIIRAGQSSKL